MDFYDQNKAKQDCVPIENTILLCKPFGMRDFVVSISSEKQRGRSLSSARINAFECDGVSS